MLRECLVLVLVIALSASATVCTRIDHTSGVTIDLSPLTRGFARRGSCLIFFRNLVLSLSCQFER